MKKRLLTESQIRFVLREALLLLEGFKQDKETILELVKDKPEIVEKVSNFKPPAISWLIKRYGPNARIQETHPISDSILTLEKYILKIPQIKAKWQSRNKKNYNGYSWGEILALSYKQNNKNPSWKKPPYDWENINTWNQTPMDWGKMTADEMAQIMTLSDLKKSKNTIEEEDLPEKFIKKIGPWNIWLPATKSDSIRIAGFNPITMKSHVTWCTARTDGSNLFYNYNAVNKYLVYIIKDNPRPTPDPKGVWDYISIGIKNGEVQKDRGIGGSTVQRENNRGLPAGEFWDRMKAATEPYYDQIMATVEQIARSHSDSPSVALQIKAVQDPAIMNHVISSLGFREKITEINRLSKMARGKNVIMTPEVKAVCIDLLKIKMPNGLYNLEKFQTLFEAMTTISNLDEKYFNNIANIKNLFNDNRSTNLHYAHYDLVEGDLRLRVITRVLTARRYRKRGSGKSDLRSIAKNMDILLEAEEIINGNSNLFKEDVGAFLLEEINNARSNYKYVTSLVKKISLINSPQKASSVYDEGIIILSDGGYGEEAARTLDDFFIEKVSSDNLPLSIINRNIHQYKIRKNLYKFSEFLKRIELASTSKQLAVEFHRENTKISDLVLSLKNINSPNTINNFVNTLFNAFDILDAEEIFLIVSIVAGKLELVKNGIFANSIEYIKLHQPEKFKKIQKNVSQLLFPPKIITDIFNIAVESVDDFLDDLLGDDLFQI